MLSIKSIVVVILAVATFALVGTSVLAAPQGGTRPGWGYGDQNHTHTGPPGQSVRPNP